MADVTGSIGFLTPSDVTIAALRARRSLPNSPLPVPSADGHGPTGPVSHEVFLRLTNLIPPRIALVTTASAPSKRNASGWHIPVAGAQPPCRMTEMSTDHEVANTPVLRARPPRTLDERAGQRLRLREHVRWVAAPGQPVAPLEGAPVWLGRVSGVRDNGCPTTPIRRRVFPLLWVLSAYLSSSVIHSPNSALRSRVLGNRWATLTRSPCCTTWANSSSSGRSPPSSGTKRKMAPCR